MSPRHVAAPLVALCLLSLIGTLPPSRAWAERSEDRSDDRSEGRSDDRSDDRSREDERAAWTATDLFASPAPYAMGHRGYGENAYDPLPPLENTLDAFRRAFRSGIRVVELDLQRTADGKIVVFHDDFLEDFRCVGSMTYDELLARKPEVPLFRAVLRSSRHFGHREELSGIIFAEIKVPVPLCDGANTSEQAEISESELVAAVVADIRRARMEDQVILNSGSPSILKRAADQAPEIQRALSLNALQLLTPEQACAVLPPNLCPVRIPKNDCGLDWYNIGPIARLPAMPGSNGNERFGSFLRVALGCAGSRAVSIDKLVLLQNPAAAPALVSAVHGAGLEAIVWTVDTQPEWDLLARAGVDGITTNNIAMGLESQAPAPSHDDVADRPATRFAVPFSSVASLEPAFGLFPSSTHAARDGAVEIDFALPDGGPARLELVDIAGRMVESSPVGSFGPGRHSFVIDRALRPGIYLARLSHGQDQARMKFAVTR